MSEGAAVWKLAVIYHPEQQAVTVGYPTNEKFFNGPFLFEAVLRMALEDVKRHDVALPFAWDTPENQIIIDYYATEQRICLVRVGNYWKSKEFVIETLEWAVREQAFRSQLTRAQIAQAQQQAAMQEMVIKQGLQQKVPPGHIFRG
jgi:hypothetical protein